MEDPEKPPDQQVDARLFAEGMRYIGIASQFVITLAVFWYVGDRVDAKMGWSPWGVLAGIMAGMSLGVWVMLRELERLAKKKSDKK